MCPQLTQEVFNPEQLTKIFLKEQVKRDPQALDMRSEIDISIFLIFSTEGIKTTAQHQSSEEWILM